VQNCVAVGQTIAETWRLFDFFAKPRPSAILDLLCACLVAFVVVQNLFGIDAVVS